MQEEKKNFIKLYDYIISNNELNSNDKIILSYIISLNTYFSVCKITNEKMSINLGMSKSTVIRSIDKLIAKNYISKQIIHKNSKPCRILTVREQKIKLEEKKVRKKLDLIEYDWLNE